jgi:hypothetical protein
VRKRGLKIARSLCFFRPGPSLLFARRFVSWTRGERWWGPGLALALHKVASQIYPLALVCIRAFMVLLVRAFFGRLPEAALQNGWLEILGMGLVVWDTGGALQHGSLAGEQMWAPFRRWRPCIAISKPFVPFSHPCRLPGGSWTIAVLLLQVHCRYKLPSNSPTWTCCICRLDRQTEYKTPLDSCAFHYHTQVDATER